MKPKITLVLILTTLLSACATGQAPTIEVESVVEVYEEETEEPYEIGAQPHPAPLPTQAGPTDNRFEDYGLNPFLITSQDPLSTFAIDVDTASYSVARRYVQDGLLPPPDAIRPEEFVNYFDPGYPTPPDIAFALYADGAPSPFHQDGTYFVRLGIQSYVVPEWDRKPANLTFVIDTSGSMSGGNRLELVKDALDMLLEQLDQRDTIGIVEYGTRARIVVRPTNVSNKSEIDRAYEALSPNSSTNAEAGLRLGYQMAWGMFDPQKVNRVILLSDGVANVGATGPDAILETIGQYAGEGITLTSVGVGMGNFNDVLLEQLANKGDGNYVYIDTLDEARRVFVEDLAGTLQVIARDARIQVAFDPQTVTRYRLVGYENRKIADDDFRNDSVDAGEIGAGHSVTAIYAVQLEPGAEGRLATMRLRWEDPDTGEVIEIEGQMGTRNLSSNFEETDPHYQLAVLAAQYAEVLGHSPYAQGLALGELAQHAFRLTGLMAEDADLWEFAQLVAAAAGLEGN